jgi:hypothetical protein
VESALGQLRKGTLRNPVPGAVDFADRPTSDAFVARTPGARILACLGGNCHIATADSIHWPLGFLSLGSSWWRGRSALRGRVGILGGCWWREMTRHPVEMEMRPVGAAPCQRSQAMDV